MNKPPTTPDDRDARRAAALRENLKRRKAQARAREAPPDPAPEPPPKPVAPERPKG